jgi:lipoprotein-anchoring transpeptidase ErfK/SrfK
VGEGGVVGVGLMRRRGFFALVVSLVLIAVAVAVLASRSTPAGEADAGVVSFDLDRAAPSSPRAAMVAAARPEVGELVARREPNPAADAVATFTVDPQRPDHFLATHGYRELQDRWSELSRNGSWIEVLLPVRPNGSTGWLSLADVRLEQNTYEIVIDRSAFTLRAHRDGDLLLQAPIAVGEASTKTPPGTFYVTELIKPDDPSGAYGPYAFALSGFSEDVFEFNGGPGVLGVHGTDDPTSIGREVSFGCVRVTNDVITELAGFIPLATPVRII